MLLFERRTLEKRHGRVTGTQRGHSISFGHDGSIPFLELPWTKDHSKVA